MSNISELIDDKLASLMRCLNEKTRDRSAKIHDVPKNEKKSNERDGSYSPSNQNEKAPDRSAKIVDVLRNIRTSDETDGSSLSTSNYYLKVLKNAKGVDWKEQEKWYFKASKDFLSLQDIDGDNVLHIFARENKTKDSTKFLRILNEKLLSDRNFKNFTPIEEAIENDNPTNYEIMYEYFAVYGRLDTFQELVSQMTDVRYLLNLSHVFHGIAKASKSGDKNQDGRRMKKYNTMRKKISELDIMSFQMAINSLKLSSKPLRENPQLIRTVFQIFWSGDLNFWHFFISNQSKKHGILHYLTPQPEVLPVWDSKKMIESKKKLKDLKLEEKDECYLFLSLIYLCSTAAISKESEKKLMKKLFTTIVSQSLYDSKENSLLQRQLSGPNDTSFDNGELENNNT